MLKKRNNGKVFIIHNNKIWETDVYYYDYENFSNSFWVCVQESYFKINRFFDTFQDALNYMSDDFYRRKSL